MSPPRPTPFDLVFGERAEEIFGRVDTGLREAGGDPESRDEFMLIRESAELLHELRPEEGLGDTVEALVGFVHTSYLFWRSGAGVVDLSRDALRELVGAARGRPAVPAGKATTYVRMPSLAIWGTPVPGTAPEPLDGWFSSRRNDVLILLAVFGLHPGREAFTLVEVSGARPGPVLERPDGTPLFSPRLDGGAAAGLYSVDGEEELLELGWRVDPRAPVGPVISP